jgi:competence protein ComEC
MNLWKFKRIIHESWLITALALGIILGIIFSQYFNDFGSLGWFLTGVAMAGFALWRKSFYYLPIILIAGLLIGLCRGGVDQVQLMPYKKMIGHQAVIAGTVGDDPDIGKHDELVVRLHDIEISGHRLSGSVWVSTRSKASVKRADRVIVRGELSPGFGNFAAGMYYGIIEKVRRPVPGDIAGQVRDTFADSIRRAIPDPEASLGIGYLVGQRRSLPPELDEALKIAGLTHIVVASGYNLTILVRLARRLFMRISRYTALVASGGLVIVFIAVTGMSPSMSRAGLVAGLSLLAWYYGRKFHPLVLLPFAAAITLLVNPSYGWNDLGWQLSFAAFAGVMVAAPLLQRYFFGDKKPGTVRQILGETVAAQIMTLPIIVLAFGQFSNVAIAANLLILPLVPLAMLLTFFAGIGAFMLPGLAELLGYPATAILNYMVNAAMWLADLPWAQTSITISGTVILLLYGVISVGCYYMWRKTGYNLRDTNLVE